jgi:hypothetical protein
VVLRGPWTRIRLSRVRIAGYVLGGAALAVPTIVGAPTDISLPGRRLPSPQKVPLVRADTSDRVSSSPRFARCRAENMSQAKRVVDRPQVAFQVSL